jgi:hypothetical protein
MSTVTRPERQRLLEAMLSELAEKEYPAIEVEVAAQRACLEGDDWSTWFPDKKSCVLAALDQFCDELRVAAWEGGQTSGPWPKRVAAGVRALLCRVSEQPARVEGLVGALPPLGSDGQARYQAFVEGVAALLRDGRRYAGMVDELPASVELLAAGAAEALVFEQIRAGRASHLHRLVPEILFALLVPFVGPEAAAWAMEEERQAA